MKKQKKDLWKKKAVLFLAMAMTAIAAIWFLGTKLAFDIKPANQSSWQEEFLENPASGLPNGYEVSSGWTITSYQNDDETLYSGKKIEVFDANGNSLGYYKEDFLRQVRIDGSGNGDGVNNSGLYLHYNYKIDDGKTHYLENRSLGAYLNELAPWTGDRPSVAVNPPLPEGTEIIFLDLGKDSATNEPWVNELLLSKVFYADDTFHGWNEKKIDVYVGMQKSLEPGSESLLMRNASIAIRRHE